MTMLADYTRERLGDEVLERQEGFATYRYIRDNDVPSVYIVDIYTRPDFRKTNVASRMADEIVEKAKELGCTRLIGSVSATAKNTTDSIKALLAYGFEFYRCNQDGIIFKKEL